MLSMAKYYMTVEQTVFMCGVNNSFSISLGAPANPCFAGGQNRRLTEILRGSSLASALEVYRHEELADSLLLAPIWNAPCSAFDNLSDFIESISCETSKSCARICFPGSCRLVALPLHSRFPAHRGVPPSGSSGEGAPCLAYALPKRQNP